MAAPLAWAEHAAEGLAVTNNEETTDTASRGPWRAPGEMIRRDGFTWELTLPEHQELYNLIYSHPPGRRRACMQELMLRGLRAQQGGAPSPSPFVAPLAPVLPPKARPAPAVRPPLVPAPLVPTPAEPKPSSGKLKVGAVKGFKA